MSTRTRPRGRHASTRSGFPVVPLRALLAASAALALSVTTAVAATGGTYAMLNSSQSTGSDSTVTSGTAALNVTSPLAMPTTPMYPGLTVYGAATVQNTGDVPLSLRVASLGGPTSSTTFSRALTIGVATASSASKCADGVVTSAWTTGTFAAPPSGVFGSTVLTTGSAVVCVSVALSPNVANRAQGQSASSFRVVINGIQV